MAQTALAASLRWPVLPLNGKIPLTAHGYKDGSVDPEQIRRWWREHVDLATRFLAEASIRTAAGQLVLYGIGMAAGLAAVGLIRSAQLVLAPVQVAFMGLTATVTSTGGIGVATGASAATGCGAEGMRAATAGEPDGGVAPGGTCGATGGVGKAGLAAGLARTTGTGLDRRGVPT